MAKLWERYQQEIKAKLAQDLGIKNSLAIPKLKKIVVNMGIGEAKEDKQRIEDATKELTQLTGQKPLVTLAKGSISNFKLREGMSIGLKVTLRGKRMYDFFERLVNLAIPRIRDFRGLPVNSFDGGGNYNFGLTEQTVFPEIDLNKVKFQQGMNVTICTTGRNKNEARKLLEAFGFPFVRPKEEKKPSTVVKT
jgi:large subunit ribosomal protein L5